MEDCIKKLSVWLLELVKELGRNYLGIIAVLLVYTFYFLVDQGRDVLASLNQEQSTKILQHINVALHFISLTVLAFLVWYSPKFLNKRMYLTNAKLDKIFSLRELLNHPLKFSGSVNGKHFSKVVPRILGLLIIAIPAFSLLDIYLYYVGQVTDSGFTIAFIGFWIFVLLLFVFNNRWFFKEAEQTIDSVKSLKLIQRDKQAPPTNKHKPKRNFYLLMLLLLSTILSMGLMAVFNKGFLSGTAILSASHFIWAFFFFVLVTFRRRIAFINSNPIITRVLILLSLTAIFCYLLFIGIHVIGQETSTSIVVHLFLIALIFFTTVLRIFDLNRRWPALILATSLFCLVLIFPLKSHYELDVHISAQTKINPQNRVDFSTYLKKWVTLNKDNIDRFQQNCKSYPLYIVAAEGGGSKSAYWSLLVHEFFQKKSNGKYFNHHLFALTGASGGMTGNSMFFSMMQDSVELKDISPYSKSLMNKNYLSNSIIGLLGLDYIKSWFCGAFDNRNEGVVHDWETTYINVTRKNNFAQPLLSNYYAKEGTLKNVAAPLLFINSTLVNEPKHVVFAPVNLDESYFNYNIDLLKEVSEQPSYKGKNVDVKLSSATICSASFPYVCNANYVEGIGQFVDAGYFDNFGASTARNIMRQINDLLATDTALNKLNISPQILVFRTSMFDDYVAQLRPKKNNAIVHRKEIYAPAQTIFQTGFSHGNKELIYLQNEYPNTKIIDLKPLDKEEQPIIPTSRVLSAFVLNEMKMCRDGDSTEVKIQLDSISNQMNLN